MCNVNETDSIVKENAHPLLAAPKENTYSSTGVRISKIDKRLARCSRFTDCDLSTGRHLHSKDIVVRRHRPTNATPHAGEKDFLMRRSLQESYEMLATTLPTYLERPEPIAFQEPFSGIDVISFRRRWSKPGQLVTQNDLAALLGVTSRQIVRYEHGDCAITRTILLALSYLDLQLVNTRRAAETTD